MRFSERYGYLKPSDVIIKERITPEIENAICSCFDELSEYDSTTGFVCKVYYALEQHIWCNFLNKRKKDIDGVFYRHDAIVPFIQDKQNPWYKKLDIIEVAIEFLKSEYPTIYYAEYPSYNYAEGLSNSLNREFERLNFGYRIVDGQVLEITSEQEIETIEKALEESKDNVRMHLNRALELYSQRPYGDYRNSIKESITAVETLSREITGEKRLNFKKMEENGLKIHSTLRKAFENFYGYTNDGSTGIRHSLMDATAEYVPGSEEALYMLVTCSAFVNYINSKLNK